MSGLRSRGRTVKSTSSRSRNILSNSDSLCPISLHISDINRATYAAARASGVQCSNLFKKTLPRIARHSVRLIKSLHLNVKQIVFWVMLCLASRVSCFPFFNPMTGSKCQVRNQLLTKQPLSIVQWYRDIRV